MTKLQQKALERICAELTGVQLTVHSATKEGDLPDLEMVRSAMVVVGRAKHLVELVIEDSKREEI